jgi:hypothetical protein
MGTIMRIRSRYMRLLATSSDGYGSGYGSGDGDGYGNG